MQCKCTIYDLDTAGNFVEDDEGVFHTAESCVHEHNVVDNLFDYTCSCGQFFPAHYTMNLSLTAEAWQRLRAMIVCDVVLSTYDDTSRKLDSLVDEIDALINFDESELI